MAFFRKMYVEGLTILLVSLVLSGAATLTQNAWFAIGSQALRVVIGFFANQLYLRKFERVRLAAEAYTLEATVDKKRHYLKSKGGTSMKAAIVGTAVPLMIYLVLAGYVLLYIVMAFRI
jgi:hypothetical protein